MPLRNTETSYGSLSRLLHWVSALLILAAIALGLVASEMPFGSDAEVAAVMPLWSAHKTIGVSLMLIGLFRLIWTVRQPHPNPLHPARRLEIFLARLVHWLLWGAILVLPLTGWIGHAASNGYAPILWPFGQSLPLVPKNELLERLSWTVHIYGTKVLIGALILHVAGALKHMVIDRDDTLARMLTGRPAGQPEQSTRTTLPALLGLSLWLGVMGAGAAMTLSRVETDPVGTAPTSTAGNWQVSEGTLGFTARQIGQPVQGRLPIWSAEVSFDETITDGPAGNVTVTIDTTKLDIGTVTPQVKGTEFFDTEKFPQAMFKGEITAAAGSHRAKGTLTLRGVTVPLDFPVTITVTGDQADVSGTLTLDRRDFGMGPSYPDEKTVGYAVEVNFALKASHTS